MSEQEQDDCYEPSRKRTRYSPASAEIEKEIDYPDLQLPAKTMYGSSMANTESMPISAALPPPMMYQPPVRKFNTFHYGAITPILDIHDGIPNDDKDENASDFSYDSVEMPPIEQVCKLFTWHPTVFLSPDPPYFPLQEQSTIQTAPICSESLTTAMESACWASPNQDSFSQPEAYRSMESIYLSQDVMRSGPDHRFLNDTPHCNIATHPVPSESSVWYENIGGSSPHAYTCSAPSQTFPSMDIRSEDAQGRCKSHGGALEPPDYIYDHLASPDQHIQLTHLNDIEAFGRLSSWYNPVDISCASSSCGTPSDHSSPPSSPSSDAFDAYDPSHFSLESSSGPSMVLASSKLEVYSFSENW